MKDHTDISTLMSKIFIDKTNIEILCSLYDKNLCANTISSILNIGIEELDQHLENLVQLNIISKSQNDSDVSYYLKEPKICDSILMIKDALYRLRANQ